MDFINSNSTSCYYEARKYLRLTNDNYISEFSLACNLFIRMLVSSTQVRAYNKFCDFSCKQRKSFENN